MNRWVLIVVLLFVGAFWVQKQLAPLMDPFASRPAAKEAGSEVAVSTVPAKPPPDPIFSADPETVAEHSRPWVMFEGRVFDLLTLRPSAGMRLLFQDAVSGEKFAVTVDGKGRFRAGLLVTEIGYDLSMDLSGKAMSYREDWTPSMRTLDAEKRASIAEDPVKPERLFTRGGHPLRMDFAAFVLKSTVPAAGVESEPSSED